MVSELWGRIINWSVLLEVEEFYSYNFLFEVGTVLSLKLPWTSFLWMLPSDFSESGREKDLVLLGSQHTGLNSVLLNSCTPRTSECDLICRCNYLRWSHLQLEWILNPMTAVLLKRPGEIEKDTQRDGYVAVEAGIGVVQLQAKEGIPAIQNNHRKLGQSREEKNVFVSVKILAFLWNCIISRTLSRALYSFMIVATQQCRWNCHKRPQGTQGELMAPVLA